MQSDKALSRNSYDNPFDISVSFGAVSHSKITVSLNAHNDNAIYTDNGLVLPKSISKQSVIIYK